LRLIAAGVPLALILVLTLRRGEMPSTHGFAWCIGCGTLGTLDLILNIALFVPFGAALAWWRPDGIGALARAAIASLLVSLAIEVSQLVLLSGRDPSLSDVIGNTLGGGSGALLATAATRITTADVRTWRLIAWFSALLSAGVLLFGAWAVGITVPHETYFVQWEPQRPNYAAFRGHLSALSLEGLTLAPGEVIQPTRLPSSFFDGRVTLEATFSPGAMPGRIAFIARVALAPDEFLMLGQRRDALVVRYRANSYRVGLRSPIFALERAPLSQPTVVARVRVDARGSEVELSASAGSNLRRVRYQISAARLWATLLPFEHAFGDLAMIGDVFWLALLFGPVAYAGARSRAGLRGSAPAGLFAVLALVSQSALRTGPFCGAVMLASLAGYLLGTRTRLGAEKPPAHRARTFEEHMLSVDPAEEA
jgi:hypothetical protein